MNEAILAEVRKAADQIDADCKAMYDWFDEHEPGDMMVRLNRLAVTWETSEQGWRYLWQFMRQHAGLAKMQPRGHFYFACAIEHAIRQQRKGVAV